MSLQTIKTAGGKVFSKGAGKLFGFIFVFIFLIIPVIYAGIISIEAGSIEPGVVYLGEKFLKPTLTLQQESIKIIEQGGAFPIGDNFLKNLWSFMVLYWSLFGALYIIYRWVWLFAKLFSMSPLSNESEKFRNWTMALITFFGLQIIYLLGTAPIDISRWDYSMITFRAWGSFVNAFPLLIKQATSFIDPAINASLDSTVINSTITNLTI